MVKAKTLYVSNFHVGSSRTYFGNVSEILSTFSILLACTAWILLSLSLTPSASGTEKNFPEFPPCAPESKFNDDPDFMPSLGFCEVWNPDFKNNGQHCCRKPAGYRTKRTRARCSKQRAKSGYCDEMTAEQREYRARGGSEDFLELLFLNEKQQSYCSVNTGFLAHGRPIVPSAENRIRLRAPNRCTEFGTDPLIGMLEWLGRAVRENYDQEKFPGAELIIGDISAPRGGCLSGTGGKRGHLSHTTGQDVDLGFFIPTKKNPNPSYFQREFDPESNWWILKNLFRNPYACIKVIFLDRSLIRKLRQFAKNDLEWLQHEKFFRHMPGHKNHFHVRVKEEQRGKGCDQSPEPLDLEDLESLDGVQADET